MDVSYKEIVEGYILKEGDTLVLHGIEYIVDINTTYSRYFLKAKSNSNDLVFNRLGIKDKQDYCKEITGIGTVFWGIFPEIDTLENLTKITKALYEHSPYKVGERVKLVSDLKGLPWIASGMLKYAGQTVTIKGIELRGFSDTLNGDPHAYTFKEICYTWPPQAIECKVTSEPEESENETSEDETSEESQPKTVSRIDLERGYILKQYNVIYIAGIKHRVHPDHFLATSDSPRFGRIFEILGLTQKEKDAWAAKFGCKHTGQQFPEFDTYEDLTKFVLDIFKKYDEFEKAKSSPALSDIASSEKVVYTYCDISSIPYYKIKKDVRPDCHFNNEPIIINNQKSKTKTIIKL